jgi:uncharacterized protein YjbI with pentapeptide repeats
MRIIRYIILAILIIAAITLIYWAVHPENSPEWTGFGTFSETTDETRYKTLWDWLDLIIIPVSIGLFAWIITEYEKDNNKRIEVEKSRENILDSFIRTMTELLVQYDLAGNPDQKRLAIAKTRINMALSQLDGSRKGQILQFLYESDLIDKTPKFKLRGANFNNAVLDNIVLGEAEIRSAHFEDASLINANLNGIILNSCNFTNADLTGSQVDNTDFGYTNLTNSRLLNMDLTSVDFEGADLTNADLEGSKIKQEQLNNIWKKEGIKISKTEII